MELNGKENDKTKQASIEGEMDDTENKIKEKEEDLTIKGTIKEIGNLTKRALAKANLLKTPPILKERGEEKEKERVKATETKEKVEERGIIATRKVLTPKKIKTN